MYLGQAQVDTSGAIVSADDIPAPTPSTVTPPQPNYLLWGLGLAVVLFALWYFTKHHRRGGYDE